MKLLTTLCWSIYFIEFIGTDTYNNQQNLSNHSNCLEQDVHSSNEILEQFNENTHPYDVYDIPVSKEEQLHVHEQKTILFQTVTNGDDYETVSTLPQCRQIIKRTTGNFVS